MFVQCNVVPPIVFTTPGNPCTVGWGRGYGVYMSNGLRGGEGRGSECERARGVRLEVEIRGPQGRGRVSGVAGCKWKEEIKGSLGAGKRIERFSAPNEQVYKLCTE